MKIQTSGSGNRKGSVNDHIMINDEKADDNREYTNDESASSVYYSPLMANSSSLLSYDKCL